MIVVEGVDVLFSGGLVVALFKEDPANIDNAFSPALLGFKNLLFRDHVMCSIELRSRSARLTMLADVTFAFRGGLRFYSPLGSLGVLPIENWALMRLVCAF